MGSSPQSPVPASDYTGTKIAILFGVVIALIAANVYLFLQVDSLKSELAKSRESILSEVASVRETHTLSTQTSRQNYEKLQSELEAARRRADAVAGAAKEEALRQVVDLERKVAQENRKQEEQMKAELSKVEASAAAATTSVKETLSAEVGAVKTEVSATKSELEKTIAELKKVTGDLGVQSGLIATNSKELAALKQLGERNYFEFNLVKSKKPIRLADITIQLKNADVKRNRFTVDIVADDKKVEKKDKSINEPVQFYMAKFMQPCELVVNQVAKDRIVGYLSQPKVQRPRN